MFSVSYNVNYIKHQNPLLRKKNYFKFRREQQFSSLQITCKKRVLKLDKRAPKPEDARLVALKQLMRIEKGLIASDQVLDSPLMDFIPKVNIKDYKIYPERIKIKREYAPKSSGGEQQLTPEGQLFVQEVVSGVTRWRLRLDDIIMAYLKKATLKDLDIVVLNSLRIGIYEVLEMDLPALDINKVISLPRAFELPRQARSTINSVLRKITVHKYGGDIVLKHDFLGGKETFKGSSLASGLSHPEWLVRRWMKRYGGEDAINLMMQNNSKPKYTIRIRKGKKQEILKDLENQGCKFQEGEFLKDEFVVVEEGLLNLLSSDLLQNGDVCLQDISSGLVVDLLDPQPGDRIADVCCTPGEKTLHIASRMEGKGQILAVDFDSGALTSLKKNAESFKLANIITTYEQDVRQIGISKQSVEEQQEQEEEEEEQQQQQQQRELAAAAVDSDDEDDDYYKKDSDDEDDDKDDRGEEEGEDDDDESQLQQTAVKVEESLESEDQNKKIQIETQEDDEDSILKKFELFDKVLLDVPCSGFGLLSKKAELRWNIKQEQVKKFIVTQRKLLQGASKLVKPGGYLVFCANSFEPEETKNQISYFLENNDDFQVEKCPKKLLPESVVTEEGWMQTMPHKHFVDGTFAVRLRRKDDN